MASLYFELTRLLRRGGCEKIRDGKHEIWRAPNGRVFAIPRKVKSKHTANDALRQAGLEKAF
jgi:hypothetical protein